jgi:Flp pilus assembly pilin Flp
MLRNRKGQSSLEYALIIAAVIAALVVMAPYVRKAVQGRIRVSSDQVGDQFSIKKDSQFTFKRQAFGGQKASSDDLRTTTKETRYGVPGPESKGGSGGAILSNTSVSEIIESKAKDDWGTGVSAGGDVVTNVQ